MDFLRVPRHLQVKDRTIRLMLYTLFALIVADGLITEFLVNSGNGLELNPFLEAWVSQDVFLAIKVSGAFLATLYLWYQHSRRPRLTFAVTVAFTAFYTTVLFWNLFVFLTA